MNFFNLLKNNFSVLGQVPTGVSRGLEEPGDVLAEGGRGEEATR